MAPNRKHDGTADHDVRSDRCIVTNGSVWYVATREGIDFGPFETRADAESAAQKIGQLLLDVDNPEATLTLVRAFLRRTRV